MPRKPKAWQERKGQGEARGRWERANCLSYTQPTTEPHLSLFSPPPFLYLYPLLVVAGNRALSGAHLPRQIYGCDARFECLEKRFAFESIDLRYFDSPRGNNLGRHIGSDATTIFDSFVPTMNFQVVASSMLPRSIAKGARVGNCMPMRYVTPVFSCVNSTRIRLRSASGRSTSECGLQALR